MWQIFCVSYLNIQGELLDFTNLFDRSHKLYVVQSYGISERLSIFISLGKRMLQIYGSIDFPLFWVYPVASYIFDSSMILKQMGTGVLLDLQETAWKECCPPLHCKQGPFPWSDIITIKIKEFISCENECIKLNPTITNMTKWKSLREINDNFPLQICNLKSKILKLTDLSVY